MNTRSPRTMCWTSAATTAAIEPWSGRAMVEAMLFGALRCALKVVAEFGPDFRLWSIFDRRRTMTWWSR